MLGLQAMKSLRRLGWFSALVLSPFGLYVASYYAFVEAAPMRWMTGQGRWPGEPHYRLGDWFERSTPVAMSDFYEALSQTPFDEAGIYIRGRHLLRLLPNEEIAPFSGQT